MHDFKQVETHILNTWKEKKIFDKTLELRRNAKRFVFWEGPPTANGLPGIHHFFGRAFKDLFCRYKTMRGFFVLRKAGWDTHGLPVEIEVEKQLGFKHKKEIEEYGIAKFNRKARESVWKYKHEWENMTERMGFWLDLENPYITYETNYMESIWSILKEISDKGLLYQAHKVVPFCVRCGTPLSAHEVAQGYQTVKDRSVYLKFKVKGQENTFILAWTTTPWTLPGNVALAVGNSIEYVKVKQNGEYYILAKELLEKVIGSAEIIETMPGSQLVGLEYETLFEVNELQTDKSYKVYEADFVSTVDGTGVVHTAVMYGVDDYDLGTKLGLPKVHTVDEQGKFLAVTGKELEGRYVKDKTTEEFIVEDLKKRGLLLKEEMYEHEYPFCWRCSTPLLYYAKTSWFIKTSAINQDLLANNSRVNWIPDHIRDGRFGQWIREGKDWTLSRERYWGTPLPIWACDQCDNKTTIGSVKELEKSSLGPKNTYYVMRHGSTARNERVDKIINSRLDHDKYPLTSEGQAEVESSASKLAILDNINLIYASPFQRTQETAKIAGRVLHVEVVTDDRLIEIKHHLDCEGRSDNLCEHASSDTGAEMDGESWNQVRERLMNFMAEMESKYKNKKILIVTHGDPIWLLSMMAEGIGNEEGVKRKESGQNWYPMVAEFSKLTWRKIPRNEFGELDLHRPFVDEVTIRCSKCRSKMHKIPDLIDVWFDSGAMPYAQWHYPFENKPMFKKQFPADFIVEGIDQTRGWFYTLLTISTLLGKGEPYKNVMSYSHVLDEKGQKMSKSKGNVVSPTTIIEKYGVDAPRWYFYTVNSPGDYKLFNEKDIQAKLVGFITTLQNCLRFYELYQGANTIEAGKRTPLDNWMLSRLNRLVRNISIGLDSYEVMQSARAIETFVIEDLSNWWLRRSRKRKEALPLLRTTMLEVAKLLAPFMPFLAEDIYTRMGGELESVHLADWPKPSKSLINDKLEVEMDEIKSVIASGLAQRKEKQMKVRQPLAFVSINRAKKFNKDLEALIMEELNVKKVKYDKGLPQTVMLNFELSPELVHEGYAREMMRQIQDMRKEAKYNLDEKVSVNWHTEDTELKSALEQWSESIKTDTILKEFLAHPKSTGYDVEKEMDLAPNKHIWIGIRK